MSTKTNPSYCSYLWQGLSLRDGESVYPCCRFELDLPSPALIQNGNVQDIFNSLFYQKIRKNALNGVKNTQCQKCYLEEEHGFVSERMTGLSENSQEFSSTETSLENIRHFEVFIGRVCNLKCHGCHPQLSTKWEEDYRAAQWGWTKPTDFSVNYDEMLRPMKSLEHLKIIGGEPALSKKTSEILRGILPQIRKNITIEISTNGTQLFSEEVLNLLADYKKVHFSISVDGPEKINELIRHPSKWNTLEENIARYVQWAARTPNIRLILHCTVSSLNVFSLQALEEWWIQKADTLPAYARRSRYALLTQPEHMFVGNLPLHLKQLALSKLSDKVEGFRPIRSLLSDPQPGNRDLFTEFLKYCSELDRIRRTSTTEVIPELFT